MHLAMWYIVNCPEGQAAGMDTPPFYCGVLYLSLTFTIQRGGGVSPPNAAGVVRHLCARLRSRRTLGANRKRVTVFVNERAN